MDTTRKSLLLRVKDKGDTLAWREFDAIYRPMLRRFTRRCGLSDADAEDITQQCMLSLMEHISRFDYDPEKGRFKSYLRTIAINYVRKRHRKKREKEAVSQDLKKTQHREPSPEAVFEKLWLDEHLKHCLSLIKPEVEESTFKAFCLYVLKEKSVEDVCKELGITPNQVYKSKWRITPKLHEKMHEILGQSEP